MRSSLTRLQAYHVHIVTLCPNLEVLDCTLDQRKSCFRFSMSEFNTSALEDNVKVEARKCRLTGSVLE